MNWKIACLALATLATSACEHPFANRGPQGLPPLTSAVTPSQAAETEIDQALRARATLQVLLGRTAAHSDLPVLARVSPPVEPAHHATDAWLEVQSSTLRSLAERARAARQALDAQPPQD